MRLSIIIPTLRENENYLKLTIESIRKYAKEDNEIIVATNNGPAWDVPIEGIKVVHREEQGQCGAVNLGVKNATNEYIYISDDDVVFAPNWEELTEKAKEVEFLSGNFMENATKGGAAAPFVVNNCGTDTNNFDWAKWDNDSLTMKEDRWQNGFGFPLICKKSLWEEIEGYDENLDPWGSGCDSDIEYKVALKGIMPMRWRGVLTYHFSQVSGSFTKPEALPFWDRNRRYFEQKFGIARAGSPDIWFCNFKIDGKNLRYRPSWAKLYGNSFINW